MARRAAAALSLERRFPPPGLYGTCILCGMTAPKVAEGARGGVVALEGDGDAWVCCDGRECGLRYRRGRRKT